VLRWTVKARHWWAVAQNTTHSGAFAAPSQRSSCLRHGGQTSMRLGPTASQRQAKTVCTHLGLRWEAVKVVDGDMARPRFIVVEGILQWFSSDNGGTYGCGGPWRSSRGSWFGKSGSVSRRLWPFVALRFRWDFFLKIWALGLHFIGVFVLITCRRWPLFCVHAGFEQEFHFDLILRRFWLGKCVFMLLCSWLRKKTALVMGGSLGRDLATGPRGWLEKREKWRGVGRA
jgi:hypothetical protein